MGADASPYARLQRALDRKSLVQAEAAARELPILKPEDSLRLLLLMAAEEDGRFETWATRWLGLLLIEHPTIGLGLAREAADSLRGLAGVMPEVARSRLVLILRTAELVDAARVLEGV